MSHCDPAQMALLSVRYLKRWKEKIVFMLLLVVFFMFWVNVELKNSLSARSDSCPFPCDGTTCKSCHHGNNESRIPVVNIFEQLKLKQALRWLPRIKRNDTLKDVASSGQVCKRPAFDLNHDSVKYAFFSLDALNCSGDDLFYTESGIFKLNKTKLKDRELEKCMYYGIERETDMFSTYTEAHIKEKEPFDIRIHHDFVRIKCFLKKEKTNNEDNDIDVAGDRNEKDADKNGIDSRDLVGDEEAGDPGRIIRRLLQDNNRVNTGHTGGGSHTFHSDKTHSNETLYYDAFHEKQELLNTNIKKKLDSNMNLNKSHENKANVSIPKEATGAVVFLEEKIHSNKSSVQLDTKALNRRQTIDQGNDEAKFERDRKAENIWNVIQRRSLKSDYNYHNDIEGLVDSEDSDNILLYDDYSEWELPDFDQLLVQVYPKPEVFEQIASHKSHGERMNVLMFGLDSLSHLAYQRKLPKTYRYLKEELGSVILDGYNIVGDGTTAALIPMLTGMSETELPEVRKRLFDSNFVNNYPLIWKDFRDNGYVTMFAEDEPSISTFNLRLNGFREQPTDHYMRPFWQALWDSQVRSSSPRYCTGNKPNHMYLIDYAKDFFIKYNNVSKFAFVFGGELSHWDNNPVQFMDEDFVKFLTFLKENGHLDNTLLIVMSDHGARYSRVRKTVQGKMEERLPMMSLLFPKWFQEKYPHLQKNLLNNYDRLATPFDIYETLKDTLDLKRTKSPVNTTQRGISLLQSIPPSRTCAGAAIEMHWCTCLKQLELDTSDTHVQRSADAILRFINSKLWELKDLCAEVELKNILYAYLLIPNEMVLMFQKSSDKDQREFYFSRNINVDHAHFQVTLETAPNKGLYEATVQVNMTAESYTVIADISRLDLYGNQPRCVQDKYPDLRKYCFCRNKDTP